jgi:hypothetical protein
MPDCDDGWLVTKAVVCGKGHIDLGTACQDACDFRTSSDGRWLVAAVSDGAGSAPRSGEASQLVVREVVAALIAETPRIDRDGPGAWLKDRIQVILIDIREKLRKASASIADFHCTLIAVLAGPSGGIFFHVGDGAAFASNVAMHADPDGDRLMLWNQFTISEPSGGEYANETFFITQDDWDKHLRKTALPRDVDIIALMSDGAMSFILPKGKRPYFPFVEPMIQKLMQASSIAERNALLEGYLAAPKTDALTHDDKTLLVAFRRRLTQYAGYPIGPSPFEDEAHEGRDPMEGEPTKDKSMTTEPFGHVVRASRSRFPISITISVVAFVCALAALALGSLAYVESCRPISNASDTTKMPQSPGTATVAPLPELMIKPQPPPESGVPEPPM